jgi:hypothetical protein
VPRYGTINRSKWLTRLDGPDGAQARRVGSVRVHTRSISSLSPNGSGRDDGNEWGWCAGTLPANSSARRFSPVLRPLISGREVPRPDDVWAPSLFVEREYGAGLAWPQFVFCNANAAGRLQAMSKRGLNLREECSRRRPVFPGVLDCGGGCPDVMHRRS